MNEPALSLNRRELLHLATAAGAAALLASRAASSADQDPWPFQITDTNVSLFQWPFRRLPLDTTELLVKKLRSLGISQAWAGSFEGVFHRNVAGVNERLAAECAKYRELLAFGTVNLNLPDWEHDLKQCIEKHAMPGIRLHPNYHGYTLDDPRFARVLKLAASGNRLVQIAVALEDIRTQPSNLVVEDVDLTPLAEIVNQTPGARVQILNWRPRAAQLAGLAKSPRIAFDVARVEGTDGVPELVKAVPAGGVFFGTHAPFLIPEAALIRTHESSRLAERELRDLLSQDATRFLQERADA